MPHTVFSRALSLCGVFGPALALWHAASFIGVSSLKCWLQWQAWFRRLFFSQCCTDGDFQEKHVSVLSHSGPCIFWSPGQFCSLRSWYACDYSCRFSVWKSKAEDRSWCARLLWQRELRYQAIHPLPLVNRMSRYSRSSKQWLATSLLGGASKMRLQRVWLGTWNLP